MLQEFATWYGRQMGTLLPSLAARAQGRPDGLLVILDAREPAIALAERRRGKETAAERFTLDPAGLAAARVALQGRRTLPAFLRLPPGMILERGIVLPLAAEPSLARVIALELDRYTPFAAEEVFWAAAVSGRDRAQGRLQVALLLVPRQALQAVLGPLRTLGIVPSMLEGRSTGGAERALAIEGEAASRRARRQRRLALVAAGACAVLAAVAVGLPFWQQGQADAAVQARLAALQPRVAQAASLRQSLAARGAGSDAVQAEQAQVADSLQAIAALTQILPDDTYLTGLVLQKREVSIEGQSANAARLIGLLSNDPVIRNAAFAAPVTRNDAGADLFSIKAEVKP
jgi:general secretion pathway protein L